MKTENQMKVFVVDDDPVFRKALTSYLISRVPDLQISEFPNGEEFLHHLDEKPDAVILDYYLNTEFPESWNGFEVLKKINEHDPGMAVIMLSSQEDVETTADLIHEGALEYVVKNEKALPRILEIIGAMKDEYVKFEDQLPETEEEKKIDKRRLIVIIIGILIIVILLLSQ